MDLPQLKDCSRKIKNNMTTRLLTPREYPTKYWSAQDLIQREVQREAECMIPDRSRELRPDFRPHKVQWSQVVRQAFAKGIYQYLP